MAPTASIFPPLSRTFKSQPYLPNNHDDSRKRKRSESKICFEVRPSTNGVGMFATKHISCGDLIIANEDPIVCCRSVTLDHSISNTCNTCATPIGSLRKNHLMAPDDLILPYLDHDDERLVFTTTTIPCCKEAAWCSNKCYRKGRVQHDIVCNSSSLKEFYSNQENPIIFQLATQSITLIISHYFSDSLSKKKEDSKTPIQQFYWWKDYGSHPLWWEVGSLTSRDTKKDQATKFCKVLQEVLIESDVCEKSLAPDLISQVCNLENVGSILGMLQCNVMEYEYPSPIQQYMEHVGDILEQVQEESRLTEQSKLDDCQGGEDDESHAAALKAGCEWLIKRIHNKTAEETGSSTANDSKDKQQTISNAATTMTPPPILGSGLYPLLTLANHDCNPNASIEYLQESNRGSMVATRDILVGEEICITYVVNGEVGGGDGCEYFRHFGPTRMWKWLNSNDDDDGDEYDESCTTEQGLDENEEHDNDDHDCLASNDGSVEEQKNEEEQPPEGSNQIERANALLGYGFDCQCQRCLNEKGRNKSE
ncbi:hypothetical protein ACHAXR_002163 [Thalassiosira sp. AJA248-18]